jgi:hypothetical protein
MHSKPTPLLCRHLIKILCKHPGCYTRHQHRTSPSSFEPFPGRIGYLTAGRHCCPHRSSAPYTEPPPRVLLRSIQVCGELRCVPFLLPGLFPLSSRHRRRRNAASPPRLARHRYPPFTGRLSAALHDASTRCGPACLCWPFSCPAPLPAGPAAGEGGAPCAGRGLGLAVPCFAPKPELLVLEPRRFRFPVKFQFQFCVLIL